jgi:hypothetical protein
VTLGAALGDTIANGVIGKWALPRVEVGDYTRPKGITSFATKHKDSFAQCPLAFVGHNPIKWYIMYKLSPLFWKGRSVARANIILISFGIALRRQYVQQAGARSCTLQQPDIGIDSQIETETRMQTHTRTQVHVHETDAHVHTNATCTHARTNSRTYTCVHTHTYTHVGTRRLPIPVIGRATLLFHHDGGMTTRQHVRTSARQHGAH